MNATTPIERRRWLNRDVLPEVVAEYLSRSPIRKYLHEVFLPEEGVPFAQWTASAPTEDQRAALASFRFGNSYWLRDEQVVRYPESLPHVMRSLTERHHREELKLYIGALEAAQARPGAMPTSTLRYEHLAMMSTSMLNICTSHRKLARTLMHPLTMHKATMAAATNMWGGTALKPTFEGSETILTTLIGPDVIYFHADNLQLDLPDQELSGVFLVEEPLSAKCPFPNDRDNISEWLQHDVQLSQTLSIGVNESFTEKIICV